MYLILILRLTPIFYVGYGNTYRMRQDAIESAIERAFGGAGGYFLAFYLLTWKPVF
jgi:hypothetical protein